MTQEQTVEHATAAARINELESALDVAISYIEEISGSDFTSSHTAKFLCEAAGCAEDYDWEV